jgi:internalin A
MPISKAGTKIPVKTEPPAQDETEAMGRIEQAERNGGSILDLTNLGLYSIPGSILILQDTLSKILLGNAPPPFSLVGRKSQPSNNISDFSLLKEFPRLKSLSVSRMPVSSIAKIPCLEELEELDMSYTGLHDISYYKSLPNLKVLNLEGNEMIDGLYNLRLPNLENLNLKGTHTIRLDFLSGTKLKKLRILDLSNNPIRAFDRFGPLPSLTNLEELRASRCDIHEIGFLATLKKLKILDLANNMIEELTPLFRLTRLEQLNLSKNRLNNLTPLKGLKNLNRLYLDRNRIFRLDVLADLHSLTHLSLSYNLISKIKPLAALTSLEYLNLRRNEIKDISPLKNLLKNKGSKIKLFFERVNWSVSNRKGIILSENPITNPPVQYLTAGSEAIVAYWQQDTAAKVKTNREEKLPVKEAKLILLGNSHVGKSTLAHLLKNNALPSTSLPSTHGLEFSTWQPDWKIGKDHLTINIIDFGGQEYYHDTHHLFFNDKAAYLLLWEPRTNVNKKIDTPVGTRDHLEVIRHFTLDYWLNAIEIYGGSRLSDPAPDDEGPSEDKPNEEDDGPVNGRPNGHPPVLLVQTFADNTVNALLNLQDLQKNYWPLVGSLSINMDIKKQEIKGIGMLQLMIKEMYEAMPESIEQRYFESWITIRKYIEETETDQHHIFNIERFRKYFLDHSGTKMAHSDENIRTLCITLDYWGVVLYRYEIPDLRDIVIVNPQHFTGDIHRLLTDKIRENNGTITRPQVIEALKINDREAETFLTILVKFKIIFELPQKDATVAPCYISPMYLPERPGYVDLFLGHFTTFYRLKYEGYFHKGILLDCFRELGQDLYFDQRFYFYWQWGLVLKKDDRVIFIEFDENNLDQVLIRMNRNGQEKLGDDPFLQQILRSFESINRPYKCDLEFSPDGKRFVPKKHLQKEMALGLNIFEWEGGKADLRDFLFLFQEKERYSPYKRVFISYSSKDRISLDKLTSHLELYKSAGVITYWDDLMLASREEWNEQIREEMQKANILIMLLSSDYFGTSYIVKEEIPIALKSLEAPMKTKQVFWVLLRPCNYELFPEVARYPIYPLKETDELSGKAYQRAISEHENQDREWAKLLKMIFEEY